MLLAAADLTETARQQGDPLKGTLRIGVILTVCPYLLPEVAPQLRRSLPGLQIVWSEDKTQTLLTQVAGTGVTLLRRMAVAVENRRGQLAVRSFKSPAPTRSLILAWRRGSALRSPLAAVAAVLRTGVGDLYRTTATPRR